MTRSGRGQAKRGNGLVGGEFSGSGGGRPGIEVNSHVGLGDLPETHAGVVATAARVVNAIEAVCAAEPGLRAVTDLPAALVGRAMH